MQANPDTTKESMSAGPVLSCAAMPVNTKMPVPIMAPMPRQLNWIGPRIRRSRFSPSISSSRSLMGFFANKGLAIGPPVSRKEYKGSKTPSNPAIINYLGNSGTETEFLKYKKFGLRPRITPYNKDDENCHLQREFHSNTALRDPCMAGKTQTRRALYSRNQMPRRCISRTRAAFYRLSPSVSRYEVIQWSGHADTYGTRSRLLRIRRSTAEHR